MMVVFLPFMETKLGIKFTQKLLSDWKYPKKVYGVYSFPDLQSNGATYPKTTSCNQNNKPGVFVQVIDYVSWINANMK